MKFIKPLIISLILVISLCVIILHAASTASVTFILGNVQVKNTGGSKWNKALLGQNIKKGNALKTLRESRAEVKFPDSDGVVRIGENSELSFREIEKKGNNLNADADLKKGKLWMNVKKKLRAKDKVRLKTPVIVAAVRGTVYRVDAEKDTTDLLVYQGEVEVSGTTGGSAQKPDTTRTQVEGPREVEGPQEVAGPVEVTMEQWVELIRAGQIIRIAPDGSRQVFTFDAEADSRLEWVLWNRNRDREF